MDFALKLLEWALGLLNGLWSNSEEVQLMRMLRSELKSPEYKLRSFEWLVDQCAVHDENPNEVRRLLIRIGARRYRDKSGKELWGFPSRNVNRKKDGEQSKSRQWPFILFALIAISIFVTYTYYNVSAFRFDRCPVNINSITIESLSGLTVKELELCE